MAKRYGSDVMVDAIQACGFKYVSLNPGSSYRGLHDSLVNYGGNRPEIMRRQPGSRPRASSTTSSACSRGRWASTTRGSTAHR
jgi:hypothetical protein